MGQIILNIKNLVKIFDNYTAVNDISFVVPKGKVIGLLGPNGAGKSTTIHMLQGLIIPNSGTIEYFGKDFAENKQECLQKINFTSSYNDLQGRNSALENLIVFANLYSVKNPKQKIMELVKYFQAEDLLSKEFLDLSAGQKTRINIIKSLLNDPELILMDEPTASLDPDVADKTLSLIESLRKSRELSILYTSHNMDEVERICDEVIFLDHGKIVAQDTPLGLTKRVTQTQLRLTFEGKKEKVEAYLKNLHRKYSFPNDFTVIVETDEKLIATIISSLNNQSVEITDIEVKKPKLEDFFLQIARGENHVLD